MIYLIEMFKYLRSILVFLKDKYLKRKLNDEIVKIYKGVTFGNVIFEGKNTLFENVRLYNSSIGLGTYIGILK